MSKTEFKSQLIGSTPLFPRAEVGGQRAPEGSAVIERFFAALVDELKNEGTDQC